MLYKYMVISNKIDSNIIDNIKLLSPLDISINNKIVNTIIFYCELEYLLVKEVFRDSFEDEFILSEIKDVFFNNEKEIDEVLIEIKKNGIDRLSAIDKKKLININKN